MSLDRCHNYPMTTTTKSPKACPNCGSVGPRRMPADATVQGVAGCEWVGCSSVGRRGEIRRRAAAMTPDQIRAALTARLTARKTDQSARDW